MRAYPASMGTRPLFAFILMIAVLFGSALAGTAAASAAIPRHDMQMMEMGHCASVPPGHDDGKSAPKQCCVAMCMAGVAIAPSASADELVARQVAPIAFIPAAHDGYLGEIATPPPRSA